MNILNWIVIGFATIFLGINGFFIFGNYNLVGHILTNAILVGSFLALFWMYRRITSPKGMEESIATARNFFKKTLYGNTDVEPPLEVVEAARYKEDILKTRKNVVHSIVFRNTLENKDVLVKDDPFIRSNPASVVFFNPDIPFLTAPYQTKAEMEKQIKYVGIPQKKPEYKYRIVKKEEKEEVKT